MHNLTKGNLAEMLFERIALHLGWFVKYTGDQYHGTLSPITKKLVKKTYPPTPDFELARDVNFTEGKISVEVKYRKSLDRWNELLKNKGKEGILIMLTPEGYKIDPPERSQEFMTEEMFLEISDLLARQRWYDSILDQSDEED